MKAATYRVTEVKRFIEIRGEVILLGGIIQMSLPPTELVIVIISAD